MFKEKNNIIFITGLSHLIVHAQMMVFPTLLLLFQNEYQLGLDKLGLMATIGSFMFGLGAIPAGIIEKYIGARTLLVIYQLGSAIGGVIIITANTPFQITIGLGILGLSSSIYHPAGLTILSRNLDSLSRGLGLHGIAGSLGLALGPLFAGITAELGSWRLSYLIWVLLQLGLAMASHIMISDNNSKIKDPKTSTFQTNKISLSLYYLMAIAFGFSFGGFSTYMPSLFGMQTEGIFSMFSGSLKTGFFTTLVFLCGILGQAIGGYLGDKFSRTRLLFIIILLNIPFLALMGFTKSWLLLLCSIVFGIVYFSNQPISNALLADITSNAHRGLGYGISFFLSFGIGGIAPAICGWIAETYTLEMVFPMMALSLLPGLVACLFLIKQKNVQIS